MGNFVSRYPALEFSYALDLAFELSATGAMLQLLRQLAIRHSSLLLSHLEKHKSALGLCVAFIAGSGSLSAFDDPGAMYTSDEEDYFSEDEEVMMV